MFAAVAVTKPQVIALYPGIDRQPHKYSDGQYLRAEDPAGGKAMLAFETDGKDAAAKAVAWRIGLPPQVDYVEGCS